MLDYEVRPHISDLARSLTLAFLVHEAAGHLTLTQDVQEGLL